MKTMNCKQAKMLLSEYLDAMLDPGIEAPLRAHLETCPDCSAELDELRRTVELVGGIAPVEAPADILRNVRAQLARPEKKPSAFEWFLVHPQLHTVAAAAAVLLIATYVCLTTFGPHPVNTMLRRQESARAAPGKGEVAPAADLAAANSPMEPLAPVEDSALKSEADDVLPAKLRKEAGKPGRAAEKAQFKAIEIRGPARGDKIWGDEPTAGRETDGVASSSTVPADESAAVRKTERPSPVAAPALLAKSGPPRVAAERLGAPSPVESKVSAHMTFKKDAAVRDENAMTPDEVAEEKEESAAAEMTNLDSEGPKLSINKEKTDEWDRGAVGSRANVPAITVTSGDKQAVRRVIERYRVEDKKRMAADAVHGQEVEAGSARAREAIAGPDWETVRIPASKYEAFIQDLAKYGKTSVQNPPATEHAPAAVRAVGASAAAGGNAEAESTILLQVRILPPAGR